MSDRIPRLTIEKGKISNWSGDCVAIGIQEGGRIQESLSRHVGKEVTKTVRHFLDEGWMRGKQGEAVVIPVGALHGLAAKSLMLVGLGKAEEMTLEKLRLAAGTMLKSAMQKGLKSILCLFSLDPHLTKTQRAKPSRLTLKSDLCAMAEGVQLASYRFALYRSENADEEKIPQEVAFSVLPELLESGQAILAQTEKIVRGVFLARDLGNHHGNVVTPDYLAKAAHELSERLPIKTTVFDEKELKKRGMHTILAVGQGSVHPPRLITMEYRKGGDKPPLVVVGKGITFDSGGISLKPAANMEGMKFDMSAGATVLGLMEAVASLKWPINLIGIVPAAENLPGSTAQRPGDIVKSAKGLFIEVINTDAEGRLVLADALHYAESFKPVAIIDLATLTGACVIALGSQCSGLLGNNEDLIDALRKAGDETGERVWPLPLHPEYQELLKSTTADLKNVGDREAGTITGACFLSRFIEKDRPWAHLDIAGMAADHDGKRSYVPKGCVGYGVRLLCQLIENRYL